MVEQIPQGTGREKEDSPGGQAEEPGDPEPLPGQIPDPDPPRAAGAAGAFRHQQVRQGGQDGGGEHQHGEDHAVEDAVVRHGVHRPGVEGQAAGDDEVLNGIEPRPEIVRQAHGQRQAKDPPPGGAVLPVQGGTLPPEEPQGPQGQRRGGGGPQGHGEAGPGRVFPRPAGQEGKGHRHGAALFQKFHRHQGPQPPGGGEEARHHPVQAADRQEQGEGPEGGYRRGVPNPPPGDPRREDPKPRPRGQGEEKAVPNTAGQGGPDAPPPSQGLGGEVEGAGPGPGGAQGESQHPHGEDQLQKAHPGGPQATGEADLKAHARKTQGQVGPGKQQSAVEHGASLFQNNTPVLHYMDERERVGQKGGLNRRREVW